MIAGTRGSYALAGAVTATGLAATALVGPVDRPAGRPLRPGPDRGPRHLLAVARLARAAAVRPLRRARLDPLRLLRRHRDHAQHRRDVPRPLGAPASATTRPPGTPPTPSSRPRTSCASCWGRCSPRFLCGDALPGGGDAGRGGAAGDGGAGLRGPALDRAAAPPRDRRLRPPAGREVAAPRPRHAAAAGRSSPPARCSGRLEVVTIAFADAQGHRTAAGAVLALQAAGSCAAGLLYGLLRLTGRAGTASPGA